MKNATWQKRFAVILFSVTLVLFLSLFVYMIPSERVSVYQAENVRGYETVTDVQAELLTDSSAPAGVRKIYSWILEPAQVMGSSLLFNISHHHIDVYFDSELVYSLRSAQSNRIGRNVSSNWCSVYAAPERVGQRVTVILTPLFEAAVDKTPEFFFGSHDSVMADVVTGELPLLILSAVCVLLGLFVAAVSTYFRFALKSGSGGLIYLGIFSLSLGLWKITDLKAASLLFPEYSMVFGYISVGALFLTGLSLLMYFSTLFTARRNSLILLLSCGSSLVCLYVLAMQVFGITELRQNLAFSHMLLITAILSVPLTALLNRILYKAWSIHRTWRLLAVLFAGIGLDLLLYYKNNANGLLSFSILSFIIYTLIVFLQSVQESARKAYIDTRTGLENRTRWNELMHSDSPLPEPYAILLADLNGLKRVNDTLGHEAGDRLIYAFSSLLRDTLPRSSTLCRWGGDEFSALLTGISRPQLDKQIEKLFHSVESYNEEHPELPIHFAAGAALSAENPGVSRSELFHLADEDMYRNKQLWYTHGHKSP